MSREHLLHTGSALKGYILYLIKNFFFLLELHLQHLEVPRLGTESELQLPGYITAIATPDLSHVCILCGSLRKCRILNPLSEARD